MRQDIQFGVIEYPLKIKAWQNVQIDVVECPLKLKVRQNMAAFSLTPSIKAIWRWRHNYDNEMVAIRPNQMMSRSHNRLSTRCLQLKCRSRERFEIFSQFYSPTQNCGILSWSTKIWPIQDLINIQTNKQELKNPKKSIQS